MLYQSTVQMSEWVKGGVDGWMDKHHRLMFYQSTDALVDGLMEGGRARGRDGCAE